MFHRNALKLAAALGFLAITALAAPPRFIIDDDEYSDQVTKASAKLLQAGKLLSTEALRRQVQTRGCPLKLAAPSHQKLDPPDLCDRLRESTVAIGSYYKCPDCGEWHFGGSTGFVVGSGGVICTCCHVVLGEDDKTTESYLVAADAAGHVFPVRSVLAADPESDTCFLKVDAPALKPLPLRYGVRAGERVYCLSHPGGYYFMFTQGMVARVNRKCNEMLDEHGQTNGLLSRPVLFLNVTAEFAPGSSGAPLVDESGNVVAQVVSVAEAGEPPENSDTNAPPSPSVPVRFCTASEEILRLTDPALKESPEVRRPKPEIKPKPEVRKLRLPPSTRKESGPGVEVLREER
jgi:serine protease Do